MARAVAEGTFMLFQAERGAEAKEDSSSASSSRRLSAPAMAP